MRLAASDRTIGGSNLPYRALAVVQQVLWSIRIGSLSKYIITNNIADSFSRLSSVFCRLFEDLSVTCVIIGVD